MVVNFERGLKKAKSFIHRWQITRQRETLRLVNRCCCFRLLQITSLSHKYFRSHLEDALSQGRPLLIADVEEELDPALDNVLERYFIRVGSTYKVLVGDKEVDVMADSFKLYLTTKHANPRYTPEVYARTSIIDFTVTIKGLEDQLLGIVILTEKRVC